MTLTTAPTLLAVDGNSVFHRAFHGYERLGLTYQGQPVFAVYGFMKLLAGIAEKVKPDAIIIGFDSELVSYRKQHWPQYKAQRSSEKPEGFLAQMRLAQDIAAGCCIPVAEFPLWEADDIVASASATAAAAGWNCVVATSDRDSFALIDDQTRVLRLASGLDKAEFYDAAKLIEYCGVHPSKYQAFAALRGDTSDNLPGVAGIGEKTAAAILAVTNVEDILADPESFTATGKADKDDPTKFTKKTIEKLLAGIENYHLNRKVMALTSDLPIDLEDCRLDATPEQITLATRQVLPSLEKVIMAAVCDPTLRPAPAPEAPTSRPATSWADDTFGQNRFNPKPPANADLAMTLF